MVSAGLSTCARLNQVWDIEPLIMVMVERWVVFVSPRDDGLTETTKLPSNRETQPIYGWSHGRCTVQSRVEPATHRLTYGTILNRSRYIESTHVGSGYTAFHALIISIESSWIRINFFWSDRRLTRLNKASCRVGCHTEHRHLNREFFCRTARQINQIDWSLVFGLWVEVK